MKSIFEKNGGTYIRVGDYYIPKLQAPETNEQIGKYGRLHKKFIKENHPAMYTALMLSGNLFDYLHQVDLKAKKELSRLKFLARRKTRRYRAIKRRKSTQMGGVNEQY